MNKGNDFKNWIAIVLIAAILAVGGSKIAKTQPREQPQPEIVQPNPEIPPPQKPSLPTITTPVPAFLQYTGIVDQIKKWNQEAPSLTDVSIYGKSSKGTDLYCLRVTNKTSGQKPVVLIHSCIHGNEPTATATTMAWIGTMLSSYGKDEEVTKIIDTRDIYFVPVMCPDSYPRVRHIDGVDPNRNYPGPSNPNLTSTPSVKAMQDFFLKIKPKAVISGHTFGRIILTPYGDRKQLCPNEADYQRIIGKMSQMCQYKMGRACNNYSRPIQGIEIDWYYRNGAFSVVVEFGTHQRPPSQQEIQAEFTRTYKGALFFLQEAPLVQINPDMTELLALNDTIHLPIHVEN